MYIYVFIHVRLFMYIYPCAFIHARHPCTSCLGWRLGYLDRYSHHPTKIRYKNQIYCKNTKNMLPKYAVSVVATVLLVA